MIEVARLLADIGEMNEARWILEAAVARHPGEEALVLGLAETSLRVGDAQAAAEVLAGVSADSPRAPYAEVLRARAVAASGRLDDALAVLTAAERRYGEPVLFGKDRIDLLSSDGRYVEALEVTRGLLADPELPNAERLALTLREAELVESAEGPEAALPFFDAILEARPGHAGAAQARTAILIRLGRGDEALADLERMLAAHDGVGALHAPAAQAAGAVGDLAAVERHLRAHADAAPTALSIASLANFLHEHGRTAEGAALLAEVPESTDPLQRIELRYQAIAMQIAAGDLDSARRQIEAFERDHPRNPRLGYLLARLDLAEGRPESAAERLALVVSRLDRSDAQFLLGVALEQSGDLEGAEIRYGLVAIGGGTSQLAASAALIRVLEAQQKWEQLAGVAYHVARMAPLRDVAAQALARAQIALGDYAEAERILRAHLEESPDQISSRVRLSLALRRQGRLADALGALDEASEAQRREAAWIAERATVLGMAGRAPEAIVLLEAAEADGLATRALRHARIYLLFTSGRADEALSEIARVAEVDVSDPAPHRMAADFFASTGRFEASVEPYRRAIELAPASSDVTFRLAIALERAGRDVEAIEAYERTIELDPDAVGALNNLALALARAGRTRDAIRVAQAAFARAGEDPVVIDTLATLYLDAGLGRRAAAMLEKARRLDPDGEDVAFHLALAYRDVGRTGDARALLEALQVRVGEGHALQGRVEDALASLR